MLNPNSKHENGAFTSLTAPPAKRALSLVFIATLLSSCAVISPTPPESVNEQYSRAYPNRTVTRFTAGLSCMDKMFIEKKVEPIYITSAPIPDYSESRGTAGYAAKDMLLSAISEMTKESAALRFVAFDRQMPDIVAMQNSHPQKKNLRIPDFFIRGAVTQINTAPYTLQRGSSINLGQISSEIQGAAGSMSNSISLASVSLDLGLGLVSNYQLLPGIFSSNTFSIEKRGGSNELSISLSKVGAIYSGNENKAEALSLALRALVEVGLIELFGKLYGIPYWDCLAKIGGNSASLSLAVEKYETSSKKERVEYVYAHLKELQLVKEDAALFDGEQLSDAFRSSVMRYRLERNLLGDADIDFHLFHRVMVEKSEADAKSDVDKKASKGVLPSVTPSSLLSPDKSSSPPTVRNPVVVSKGQPAPVNPRGEVQETKNEKVVSPLKTSAGKKMSLNEEVEHVRELTNQWALAWSSRDLKSFVSFYGEMFPNLSAFAQNKKVVFSKVQRLSVEINDLVVSRGLDEDLLISSFDQSYSSNRYKSRTKKQLIWRKSLKGQWKIEKELYQ